MRTQERVTPRAAKRLATRERLFDAAVAEFKLTGIAAADIGAVVEAAGVAHGTFFFHFPTKEHVIAELGQREERHMAAELDRYLATPRDLRTLLGEFLRLAGSMERRLGRVLFKDLLALYFSPNRPELRLWPEHPVIARLIAEFDRAGTRGEVSDDVDPASGAMIFLLAVFGVLLIHDRNAARAAVLEQLTTTTLRGLAPR
jgi:TetR/AcrR family transcriptional repressor of uid operon